MINALLTPQYLAKRSSSNGRRQGLILNIENEADEVLDKEHNPMYIFDKNTGKNHTTLLEFYKPKMIELIVNGLSIS